MVINTHTCTINIYTLIYGMHVHVLLDFSFRQLENTLSPRYLFYQRQFWSCVKELVLDGLLNR